MCIFFFFAFLSLNEVSFSYSKALGREPEARSVRENKYFVHVGAPIIEQLTDRVSSEKPSGLGLSGALWGSPGRLL